MRCGAPWLSPQHNKAVECLFFVCACFFSLVYNHIRWRLGECGHQYLEPPPPPTGGQGRGKGGPHRGLWFPTVLFLSSQRRKKTTMLKKGKEKVFKNKERVTMLSGALNPPISCVGGSFALPPPSASAGFHRDPVTAQGACPAEGRGSETPSCRSWVGV